MIDRAVRIDGGDGRCRTRPSRAGLLRVSIRIARAIIGSGESAECSPGGHFGDGHRQARRSRLELADPIQAVSVSGAGPCEHGPKP